MKTRVLLVLTLGIAAGALAIPKQIDSTNTPTPTESDSVDKHIETGSDKELEQKKTVQDDTTPWPDDVKHIPKGEIEIEIQETFSPEIGASSDFIPQSDSFFDDVPDTSFVDSNFYRNTVMNKIEGELMETAAGFVPIPIFRRRRLPGARRRVGFPNRRYFYKNPYRTPYYLYPYYGFYHPRSLRYY